MIAFEYVIFALSALLGTFAQQNNNVCNTYIDYFQIKSNPNCWYNPDIVGEIPAIIKNHGYPMESYSVVTQDGYILNMFRISRLNAKEIIVLQPPMGGTGASFMKSGNGSLALGLYEAGFDVWLPQSRGTYYSRKHVALNDTDMKYWDFSFHEIGLYDFPVELELVRKVTKRSDLIVIGYSMAAASSAIYASELPRHAAEHVKVFIALSPTIYVAKNYTPRIFWSEATWELLRQKKLYTVFSSYEFAKKATRLVCQSHPFKVLCVALARFHVGGNIDNFDPAIVPVLYENFSTRLSLKILQHYKQIGMSGHFQQFDYGLFGNLMRYNSTSPPVYSITNITVPFYIIYGEKDISCSVGSVERIYRELSTKAKKYGKHIIPGYNHLDMLYAKTVKTNVLEHIINFISKDL